MKNKVESINVGSLITRPLAYNLSLVVDDNITNFLGYEPIEHFEDAEIGLVRHLGSMEQRVISNLGNTNSRKVYDSLFENGFALTESATRMAMGQHLVVIYSNGEVIFP
jgi:hypothetical protein